jgi:hypothetical protein
VQLKGLIKDGSTAAGTVLCTLPVGFRPSAKLIFQVATNPSNAARIDIDVSGSVTLGDAGANSTWLNLSDIRFVASTGAAPYAPVYPTFQNSWVNFDPSGFTWSRLELRKDIYNRVFVQGLIKDGAMTPDGVAFATIPAGYTPTEYYHIPVRSNAPFNLIGVSPTTLQYKNINTAGANAFYGPYATYYAGNAGSWTDLTLQSGWQPYTPPGGTYTYPRYTKAADGLVSLKGLIKSGTTSGNPPLAQLPVGYRPKERMLFEVAACGGYGRIDIDTTGVLIGVSVNSCWTSLDAIHFIAEQ